MGKVKLWQEVTVWKQPDPFPESSADIIWGAPSKDPWSTGGSWGCRTQICHCPGVWGTPLLTFWWGSKEHLASPTSSLISHPSPPAPQTLLATLKESWTTLRNLNLEVLSSCSSAYNMLSTPPYPTTTLSQSAASLSLSWNLDGTSLQRALPGSPWLDLGPPSVLPRHTLNRGIDIWPVVCCPL